MESIVGRVNSWEGSRWRRDIESKATLDLYRNKRGIGDEEIYSNGYGSVLLFQCRTNTLKLRWRQRFEGGAVDCPLCGGGEETVQSWFANHF